MRLLDREQIGAVLREHATALRQASPQTSGFTLGQFLGADVLVRVHEEERPDPSGGAPVLLGLRVEAFEVGSTLVLADSTLPLSPGVSPPVEGMCEDLVRLARSAASRWPATDRGLIRVAVLPPVVRTWDRELSEQGVGATRIAINRRLGAEDAQRTLLLFDELASGTPRRCRVRGTHFAAPGLFRVGNDLVITDGTWGVRDGVQRVRDAFTRELPPEGTDIQLREVEFRPR